MRKRAVEQHWREEDSREFRKSRKEIAARARRRARQEARAWIGRLYGAYDVSSIRNTLAETAVNSADG
ncbi:MAG: hypothetical protein HPY52_14960 [Firmicutes bacterium]|nr:hypothetical protein [Bacillota bacterium]